MIVAVIGYTDFDLEVLPDGPGYRTRVLSAPTGAGTSTTFPALDDAALRDVLGHVAHPRDAVHVGELSKPVQNSVQRLKGFGAGLFGTLLAGEVGEAFAASRRETAARATGLRIRLKLSSDLTHVPWEFLFHQTLDRFLGLSVDTPIIRSLDVPEPVGIVHVEPPLRILVMASDPIDHPKLDVEGELERLEAALGPAQKDGLVELERCGATMEELHDRLLHSDCHVFHYIGHGGFDDEHQDGLLVLEGPGKAGVLVPGDDLGIVLNGHHALRLAVLNTCEGARGSSKDPFAGTAQGLIQQGVPTVIAMQFPISDVAAKTFSRRLYSTIALGYPVDAALCEARKTVYLAGNRLEWATPVLYMRTPDGQIFSIEGAAPVETRVAEIDPLAPADRAADDAFEAGPATIVADGKELHVEGAHGALLTAAGVRPVRSLRRPPLDLRPKDFPELLGRDEEVRTITSAFLAEGGTASEPVEIFGPSGTGKTALVRNVAHHPSAQFPDGVVYTASRQPAPDLLRFLFQTFYETPEPLMPNDAELFDAMQRVEALVFLDDVGLDRKQLDTLKNIAPRCLFVLTSNAQLLFEGGPAFALRGLEEAAALQLLERRLGRPFTPDELVDARSLVEAVAGIPLILVQAAARIRTEGLTIVQVLEEARTRPSKVAPLVPIPALTEAETRVSAVLAAVAAPIGGDLLAVATGLPDATAVAESMQERGLVRAQGPRFSLAQAPTPELASALEAGPWGDRALQSMTTWADGPVFGSAAILEEADALLGIQRWAESRGRWESVIRLGRAIERAFAVAGRWERWHDVLQRALEAARQLEDPRQEAWALHQLGTRHVGLDQITEGRELLRHALDIREGVPDPAGAEVTRANLEFIGGIPDGGDGNGGDGNGGGGGGTKIWLWALLAAAVIVGIAAAIFWPNPAEATLEVDPDSLDFEQQILRTEGDAQTITITSTGGEPLRLRSVRIESGRDFLIRADTCTNTDLLEGESCTVTVAFRPRREGERSTALVIEHNAESSPLRIGIVGVGRAEERGSPTPPPDPAISVDPIGGLEFRNETLEQIVTISSVGTAPLLVTVTLDPTELGGQFLVDQSNCHPGEESSVEPFELQPDGDACDVRVTFLRDPLLDAAASLVITNNDTEPIQIPLQGIPDPTISVGTWIFDSEASRYRAEAIVENPGTAAFDASIGITEDGFTIDENGCGRVLIDGSCVIKVSVPVCVGAPLRGELIVLDPATGLQDAATLEFNQTCPD